ncbi:Cd(II)/Pb(II)-responsive transcriptional regulator [Caldimonas sp. KR1-144]|uniref:Cd(II)/Pb(II)-responsive transcriptional regulator n=1 Tax=Caldimonas sp. KR1-144 TaxID=3400911 RepID=UPI003BFE014C
MRIGELATAAAMDVETVRFYEKAGLLPAAAREANGYRRYGEAAAQRLRFIRNCRALDMSLDEVRELLAFIDAPKPDCGAVDQVVERHLAHVRERLDGLRRLEVQLAGLLGACASAKAEERCAIVLALSQAEAPAGVRGVHTG